jgi:hypothetical protein
VIYDYELLKTMTENPMVLSDWETRQERDMPIGFAPDRYVLDTGDMISMSEGASDVNTGFGRFRHGGARLGSYFMLGRGALWEWY